MDLPPSPEFVFFLEDDGFEPELDFELDAEPSMWIDDSSSSRVDESQGFFDIDSDFDLLDGTELSSFRRFREYFQNGAGP